MRRNVWAIKETAGAVRFIASGLTLLAALAGGVRAAGAQEPAEGGPDGSVVVTFEEAVEIALRQSSTLERARNQVALSELGVQEARLQFAPDLRLSTGWSQDFGRTFSTDEGQILSGNNSSASARISSSLTLFDGFANVAGLRAANLDEAAAELETLRAEQTVIFSVISGYLNLIAATEQVRVAEDNLAFQLGQEQQVQTLVDAGSRPVADLYQQQAQVASARSTLVEARNTRELRAVDLVQTLRLDPTGEYSFTAPEIPDRLEVETELDVDALLAAAFATRPDLEAAEAGVRSAEAGEDAARGAWWPSLSVSAGYGSSYSSATELGLLDQFNDRKSGSVGFSLSFPVFDRLGTRRAAERARIQTQDATLALDDLRQQIALEVRRVVLDRAAAVEQLAAAEAQIEAAERALEAVRERYGAGVATIFEVSQAQAELTSAVSDGVNARYSLLFQDQLLDYYVGDLDPTADLAS